MDSKEIELDIARMPLLRNGKETVLLVAVNIPGYYSLPVRVLALLADTTANIKQRYDVRFVEYESERDWKDLRDYIRQIDPAILAFSMNIWNRDICIDLAASIKAEKPEITVLVGGQETTGSVVDYLEMVPEFDYIIDGEGELPFLEFLEKWDPVTRGLGDPAKVSGLWHRKEGQAVKTGPANTVRSLDEIPSPILAGLVPIHSKRNLGVMLEGSRCCPFRCGFCFEGSKRGTVRFSSVDRLTREIDYAVEQGAHYFHIMDPILCSHDIERLKLLTDHIRNLCSKNKQITFLVEAYAEFITDEVATCMKDIAIIDIGLQTIHPHTAKSINRKYRPQAFQRGLEALRRHGAIYNLYLICGLPHETLCTYLKGILFVIDQQPVRVFFNELCLLNGTDLRRKADTYGYRYDSAPPYLIHANKWMTQKELSVAWALSAVISAQYNLSVFGIYKDTPWLPRKNHYLDKKQHIIILKGDCKRNCPSCKDRAPLPFNEFDHLLQDSENADFEIVVDNALDKNHLLQLIGQVHLAGAVRIKLITPPALFEDEKFIALLVSRGVWQFKTFIGVPGGEIIDIEDAREEAGKLQSVLQSFSLRGAAHFSPFVEVVVYPGMINPGRLRELLLILKEMRAPMISLPADYVLPENQKELDDFFAMFFEMIENRMWLKLPEDFYRVFFKDNKEGEEITSMLKTLHLVSEDSRPLCADMAVG
jgi:radical SAM superfamily enzyme YgiQ (UPF0313 family)